MSKPILLLVCLIAVLALAGRESRGAEADHTPSGIDEILEAPIKVGYDRSLISPDWGVVGHLPGEPPMPTGYSRHDALRDGTLEAANMWNEAMGVDALTWGGEYLGGGNAEDFDIIVVQFADRAGGWRYEDGTYDCEGRWTWSTPVRIGENPPRFMIRICVDPDELALGPHRVIAHEMGHIAWMADGLPGDHPPGYCGIMGPVCEPRVNYAEAARARAAWWTGVPLPRAPAALDIIIEHDPGEPAPYRIKVLIRDHDDKDGFFAVRLSPADRSRSYDFTAYTSPEWGLPYPHEEILTTQDLRGFPINWDPRTEGVCATPSAVNRNGSSEGSTLCTSAPTPSSLGTAEDVPLQGGVCNPVATTYPDGTAIAAIADAVTPPGILDSLWAFGGGTWIGFSPLFPGVSDLRQLDRLDVVFICVGASGFGTAVFTRPQI